MKKASLFESNRIKRQRFVRQMGRPNLTYKLKILLSFFQIATNLTYALRIPWPVTFSNFVNLFNFLNLGKGRGHLSSTAHLVAQDHDTAQLILACLVCS
jgi:hypothetical protein